MYLLLLLVGVVLAAAGVAMMRYAVPIEDMSSVALFLSGVVAIVGALVIGALAVVARSLSRIAERLEIQPLPLPPVAAIGHEDPAPRPARPPAAAAAAAAARPSLLGWLGRGSSPARLRAPQPPVTPTAEPSSGQVDLAPLTRAAEPTAPAPPPAPVVRPAAKQAVQQNGAASTVYRSGVIDGMAYTLFMDGSIQAELPQGTVKFANIDDLQKYLLGNR
ncbi:MAG: hypothetical protein WCE79_15400 [Xanthobacteraceae bacterium]